MIGMIVCDEYGTYHIHTDAGFFQLLFNSSYCNTGINEYPVFFSTYIIAVAATSASKAYKFYFHSYLLNCKSGELSQRNHSELIFALREQIYKNYAIWDLCFLLFVNEFCDFGKNK